MKKIIFILTITLLSNVSLAQNVTMAKAYYKKAQKEYENKHYKEAISLLERTVENLNGNTNPDIIYLEAKTRYLNDINVNRAKSLFQQFINEADYQDERINEVSQILVEIQTSDKFYKNGIKKKYEYIKSSNKNKIIKNLDENGLLLSVEIYYSDKNYNLGEIKFYDGENKVRTEIFNDQNEIKEVQYYLKDIILIVLRQGKYIVLKNKEGKRLQEYEFDENNSIINFVSFESFTNNTDWKESVLLTNSQNSYIIIEDFHYQPLKKHLSVSHKNLIFKLGLVKKIYYSSGSYNYNAKYIFNSNGEPVKKEEYNQKKKLKGTYIYKYGIWSKE